MIYLAVVAVELALSLLNTPTIHTDHCTSIHSLFLVSCVSDGLFLRGMDQHLQSCQQRFFSFGPKKCFKHQWWIGTALLCVYATCLPCIKLGSCSMSSAERLLAMFDFEFERHAKLWKPHPAWPPPFYIRPIGVDSDVATSSL